MESGVLFGHYVLECLVHIQAGMLLRQLLYINCQEIVLKLRYKLEKSQHT